MSVKEKSDWYDRKCRWPSCDIRMEDMSKRVYCNDHIDRVADFLARVSEGYYGETYAMDNDRGGGPA